MSNGELARVLGYALVDEEFSSLLASDPDTAIKLAEADLSANERIALDEFSSCDFRVASSLLSGSA